MRQGKRLMTANQPLVSLAASANNAETSVSDQPRIMKEFPAIRLMVACTNSMCFFWSSLIRWQSQFPSLCATFPGGWRAYSEEPGRFELQTAKPMFEDIIQAGYEANRLENPRSRD